MVGHELAVEQGEPADLEPRDGRSRRAGGSRTAADGRDEDGDEHGDRMWDTVARRYTRRVLEGEAIFVHSGAGFIGTTLARRLVGDKMVADNLRRDTLSGTPLAEHANFTFHQAACSTRPRSSWRAAPPHRPLASNRGMDTILESPCRRRCTST